MADLVVPQLGESISEAIVAKWLKQVGEAVGDGEPVAELETDKITVQLPSPGAGALTDRDYLAKLAAAGFENAAIEVTRVYSVEDATAFLAGQGDDLQRLAQDVDGKFVSGFVRAVKPVTASSAQTSTAAAPSLRPALLRLS